MGMPVQAALHITTQSPAGSGFAAEHNSAQTMRVADGQTASQSPEACIALGKQHINEAYCRPTCCEFADAVCHWEDGRHGANVCQSEPQVGIRHHGRCTVCKAAAGQIEGCVPVGSWSQKYHSNTTARLSTMGCNLTQCYCN